MNKIGCNWRFYREFVVVLSGKDRILASYETGREKAAYVEAFGVGEMLPAMPFPHGCGCRVVDLILGKERAALAVRIGKRVEYNIDRRRMSMKILRPEEVTVFPEMRELTPEELKEAYRLAREAFTAADLQKYTEPLDDGVPAEEVLRELEERQRQFDALRQQP